MRMAARPRRRVVADPDSTADMVKAGTYVATAGVSSTLTALFNRWRHGEEKRALAAELKSLGSEIASLRGDQALIHKDIETLVKALAKHENTNERIALLESSLKRVHERLDAFDPSGKRRK